MVSKENIKLPLIWRFVPVKAENNGAIHWKWQARTHVGSLAMESNGSFDTLTECMEDAKASGYQDPGLKGIDF